MAHQAGCCHSMALSWPVSGRANGSSARLRVRWRTSPGSMSSALSNESQHGFSMPHSWLPVPRPTATKVAPMATTRLFKRGP